jgi:hypothetical protein
MITDYICCTGVCPNKADLGQKGHFEGRFGRLPINIQRSL